MCDIEHIGSFYLKDINFLTKCASVRTQKAIFISVGIIYFLNCLWFI